MDTRGNRRLQGYVYLAAGCLTGALFLFVLRSPSAWANPANGFAMAAMGLGLSVLDFIVAYRMLRRRDLPPGKRNGTDWKSR